MLVNLLRQIDSASYDEISLILRELTIEDFISYWAYISSFANRNDAKNQLCKEIYKELIKQPVS